MERSPCLSLRAHRRHAPNDWDSISRSFTPVRRSMGPPPAQADMQRFFAVIAPGDHQVLTHPGAPRIRSPHSRTFRSCDEGANSIDHDLCAEVLVPETLLRHPRQASTITESRATAKMMAMKTPYRITDQNTESMATRNVDRSTIGAILGQPQTARVANLYRESTENTIHKPKETSSAMNNCPHHGIMYINVTFIGSSTESI